jgi:NitT/TauT family transport system permease protein
MTLLESKKNGLSAALDGGTRRRTRRTEMSPLAMRSTQLLLTIAVLGAWELSVRVGMVDEFFFPLPSDIFQTVWLWVASGFVFPHLWITLQEAVLAFLVGAAAGLLLGFVLARVRFLLWFGLGIWSKVAFGFTLVFFIVFFNTLEGVKSVDRVLVDNARMLGASEKQLLRHVFIPSALTWIFSSLHISVGFAITGAVVGEYLGASAGVGYAIAQAQGVFDTKGVFAGMFILMIVVLIIDLLVNRLERHLLRWRPVQSS